MKPPRYATGSEAFGAAMKKTKRNRKTYYVFRCRDANRKPAEWFVVSGKKSKHDVRILIAEFYPDGSAMFTGGGAK